MRPKLCPAKNTCYFSEPTAGLIHHSLVLILAFIELKRWKGKTIRFRKQVSVLRPFPIRLFGGAIAEYPTYLGPYFNGVRYYAKTKSIIDAPGTITDDEGEDSYPDDVRYALDPDSINAKLPDCLPFDAVIDKLSDTMSNYTPLDSFSEMTKLTDSRVRALVLLPFTPATDNVCFDEEIPFSCGGQP